MLLHDAVCLWWLGHVYPGADRQDVSRSLKNCSVNGFRVYGCHVFLYTAYMCVYFIVTCLLFHIVSAVSSVFLMCLNLAYARKLQ